MSDAPAPEWSGLKRFLFGKSIKITLLRVGILLGVVFVTYQCFLLPFRVQGDSMLPTLLDGTVHLSYRRAYRTEGPKRGDIVLLDIAGGRQILVKRIVGLPGERFSVRQGVIYINGEPIEEPYLHTHNKSWNLQELILRPEEYFFMGDNRSMDMASHTADTIRRERIIARVLF
jgi:signal peptidase I